MEKTYCDGKIKGGFAYCERCHKAISLLEFESLDGKAWCGEPTDSMERIAGHSVILGSSTSSKGNNP